MVVAQRGYLVPGPLRELLHQVYATNPDEHDHECSGWVAIGLRLGMTARRVRVYAGECALSRGESGLIRVETADRICRDLGRGVAEVYGPLYAVAALPARDHQGGSCLACNEPMREPALICGFCMEEGQQS